MPKRLLHSIITLLSLAFIVWSYTISSKASHPETPLSDSIPTRVSTSTDPIKTEPDSTDPSAPTSTQREKANAKIIRVVDGDTVVAEIDGDTVERKLRLLGINTPESVDPRRPVQCFGKEASHHTKEILENKRVHLEADPEADERDKYGRLLRKIILEDGTNFNELLVHDGYAEAYTSFPMNAAWKRKLKTLQADAKVHERGLWNPQTCSGIK